MELYLLANSHAPLVQFVIKSDVFIYTCMPIYLYINWIFVAKQISIQSLYLHKYWIKQLHFKYCNFRSFHRSVNSKTRQYNLLLFYIQILTRRPINNTRNSLISNERHFSPREIQFLYSIHNKPRQDSATE